MFFTCPNISVSQLEARNTDDDNAKQEKRKIEDSSSSQPLACARVLHPVFNRRRKGQLFARPRGTIAVLDQTCAIFFIAQSRGRGHGPYISYGRNLQTCLNRPEQKSKNLCKEKFHTPSKNFAEPAAADGGAFFRFLLMPSNQNDNKRSVNPKSKGSLVVHGQQFSTSAWVRGWYRYFLSLRNPRRRPRVHWPLAVAVRSASLEAPAFT